MDRSSIRLLLCVAWAHLTGCSSIVGDSSREPARLVPSWTARITIGAGQVVNPPPSVRLVDQKGRPLKGRLVEFTLYKGGGALKGTSVETDAQGMAVLGQWRVGTTPGESVVFATSDGVAYAEFDATITTGPLASLRITGGNGQQDTTNAVLRDSLQIVSSDSYGNPIGGVLLAVTPDSGSGSASVPLVLTQPWGEARIAWRVGPQPGTHRMRIRTQDDPVALTVEAIAEVIPPLFIHAGPVGVGREHSCATELLQAVYCWGSNEYGQVGDGSGEDQPLAVRVFDPTVYGGAKARAVLALGDFHSCAATSGRVWCWGRNDHGQLGDGSLVDHATPTQVISGAVVGELRSARNLTCVLLWDGLYCWGRFRGTADALRPRRVTARIDQPVTVAVADDAVCISYHNQLLAYCYDGTSVTDGTDLGTGDKWRPLRTAGGEVAREIRGAGDRFCALFDNVIYCWGGSNAFGQLGNGTTTPPRDRDELHRVLLPGTGPTYLWSFGAAFACAESSPPSCWGANHDGVFGNGFTPDSIYATPSPGINFGWRDLWPLAIGAKHACGLGIPPARLSCWGHGARGQLGNGRTQARDGFTSSPSPVAVRHR